MIELVLLKNSDKGRRVEYVPFEGCEPDFGVLVGWNEKYAIVQFDYTNNPTETNAEDLTFISKSNT